MIFNLIPIPPLDGSKVLFAALDRQTEYRIRPVLEQYGFLILIALFFFPLGDSIVGRILFPIIDGDLSASWWASKVRQFRTHLRARVTPEERAALATWTTPPQLALFDTMHVADRRHGLDVVASLRADGVDRTGRPGRRPAPRRRQGRHRRLAAGRLLARPGVRRLGLAGRRRPARDAARRSSASATHAETSARLAAAAGCSAADRRADPLAGRAARPRVRGAAAPRRRGELMTGVPVIAGRARRSRFADGRRPETATQVQVAEFEGPARAAALAHRGPPARRADRAARARSPTRTSTPSPRSSRTGSATSARSWRSPAS